MKAHYIILTSLCFLLNLTAFSQQLKEKTPEQIYQINKTTGKPVDHIKLPSYGPVTDVHPHPSSGSNGGDDRSSCDCYVQPDTSYTLALLPNDDGSSAAIPIPFNFCLYGTTYTQFWVNNNGNVTFDVPYPTFSSVPFPSSSYVMAAPFWGDVDTRNGNGSVWYKVTPTAVYVNWEAVGYYNQHGDKLNTFQLIFTDGTDPAIPNGGNIAFCYEDMQWTTGDASSGVGGFGGTPATVGVNKGNGIDYVQFGRFDQAGLFYDGPGGSNDGVDWLDNQSLYFDVCAATNIPPVFSNFGLGGNVGAGGGNSCGADTIKICATGDTLLFKPSFLGPETGETVTVSVNFNGMTNATVLSSNPGNPGSADIMLVGDITNVGFNYIDITGTDDGTPAQSTTVSLVVLVDTSGSAYMQPIIDGDSLACENTTLSLDSAYSYDSYLWSQQPSDSTLYVDTSGTYFVTVSRNNCFKSASLNVTVVDNPVPTITGNLLICPGDSSLISVNTSTSLGLPYDSLNWGSGFGTASSLYLFPGSHTLVVQDTNGCEGSVSFNLTTTAPLSINGNPVYRCNTLTGTFSIGANTGTLNGTWTYEGPAGATATFVPASSLYPTYTVSQTGAYMFIYEDLCGDKDTANVIFTESPIISLSDTFFCSENIPTFTLDPGNSGTGITYLWNTTEVTQTISVSDTGMYIVTATNSCGSVQDTAIVSAVVVNVPADTAVCGLAYVVPLDSMESPQGGFWTYTPPSSADSLSFSPGTGVDDPYIYANHYGLYSLTYTDSLCGISKTMEVNYKPFAWAVFQPDSVCIGNTLTLNVYQHQNDTYLWSTGETTPHIVVADSGWYTVTVSNECNTFTDSVFIEGVICDCGVPNIITPNFDGLNDELKIDCIQYVDQAQLQIFNRWGNVVFTHDHYDNSWNGRSNAGTDLADGTYYYVLYVPQTDKYYKGTVNILRNK